MAKRAQLLEIDSQHPEPHRIGQAVAKLRSQEIVVYPTDTQYGLAADFDSRKATERLYELRRLDRNKPLSMVVDSLSAAAKYAVISDECYRVMRRVLPGPYTFILSATRACPKGLQGKKRRTVGIRIPDSPVALELVAALGRPLITTSALTGDEPDTLSDPVELAERFGGRVALVIDSGIFEGDPSTIIDWSGDTPEIVREGAGDLTELEAHLEG